MGTINSRNSELRALQKKIQSMGYSKFLATAPLESVDPGMIVGILKDEVTTLFDAVDNPSPFDTKKSLKASLEIHRHAEIKTAGGGNVQVSPSVLARLRASFGTMTSFYLHSPGVYQSSIISPLDFLASLQANPQLLQSLWSHRENNKRMKFYVVTSVLQSEQGTYAICKQRGGNMGAGVAIVVSKLATGEVSIEFGGQTFEQTQGQSSFCFGVKLAEIKVPKTLPKPVTPAALAVDGDVKMEPLPSPKKASKSTPMTSPATPNSSSPSSVDSTPAKPNREASRQVVSLDRTPLFAEAASPLFSPASSPASRPLSPASSPPRASNGHRAGRRRPRSPSPKGSDYDRKDTTRRRLHQEKG